MKPHLIFVKRKKHPFNKMVYKDMNLKVGKNSIFHRGENKIFCGNTIAEVINNANVYWMTHKRTRKLINK
jgi:hypothetical protein